MYFNAYDWIRFNILTRYDIIYTDLKPGYYDSDKILTAGMWKVLKDFVEIEAAWMTIVFDDKYKEKKKAFKRQRVFGRLRCPELGKEYFNFHLSQTEDYHTDALKMYKKVLDAYVWKYEKLPEIEKQLEKLWEKTDDYDRKSRRDLYRSIKKIEDEIDKVEKKHLKNLIDSKNILWT